MSGRSRLPEQARPIRVLVVDDSVVVRRLLTRAFEHEDGFDAVVSAATGALALDKLEHLERAPINDAEVEDRDDAGVVEVARRPRLVEEHADEMIILAELGPQALDRYAAQETMRAVRDSLEHLGHPSLTERRAELVAIREHPR